MCVPSIYFIEHFHKTAYMRLLFPDKLSSRYYIAGFSQNLLYVCHNLKTWCVCFILKTLFIISPLQRALIQQNLANPI